jgi:STE24 endopeptidase
MHGLLIAALAALVLKDELSSRGNASAPDPEPWLSAAEAVPAYLGGLAAIWLAAHAIVIRQGRLMDRRGSTRAIRRADTVIAVSRFVATAFHIAAVFLLGWLEAVRSLTGDLVLLDEAVAILPLVAFLVAGWWSVYPIDRRVRDAVLLHRLDEGLSVHPLPSRGAFVLNHARHQLALVLVPVLLILAWGEGAQWLFRQEGWPATHGPRWLSQEAWRHVRYLALPLAQLAGVVGVFAVAPLILRHVWDTTRLGPGELRASIVELCTAARVRVRELLVWRTGGTMLNGAVIGLLPMARYILLTDALLEMLTPGQIRAVAAHEVAHVRRRHMLWLAAAVLASVFGCAIAADWVARWLLQPGADGRGWIEGLATVFSLGVGFLAFGLASRRFEWQADAFAAAHLSGHRDGPGGTATITPESVAEMTGALQAVADLNHVPVHRFTWRHGSIADRQRRLDRLVWQRTDRLGADRSARRVKVLAALGVLAVIGAVLSDLGLF